MPTIKDIAREAGVSHGTVSNVINGRGNVSVEKIQLVWQAAEKLGYKVNTKAQSLRQGSDRSIAVLLPGIEYERWASMYEVFQNEFVQHGYSVQLYSTRSLETVEAALLTDALNARVSAVISSSCFSDAVYRYRKEASDLPLVFLQRSGPASGNVLYADFDPEQAGQEIASYLQSRGAVRIGVFTDCAALPDTALFLQGFQSLYSRENPSVRILDCHSHQIELCAFEFFDPDIPYDCIVCTDRRRETAVRAACAYASRHPLPQLITIASKTAVTEPNTPVYEVDSKRLAHRIVKQLVACLEHGQSLPNTLHMENSGFRRASSAQTGSMHQCLRMLTMASPSTVALSHLLPHLEKSTGIQLELTVLPSLQDVYNVIKTSACFRYDLIRMDVAWMDELAKQLFLPLSQIPFDWDTLLGQTIPELGDHYTASRGVRYCVPYDPSTQLMFFRKDLFTDPTYKRMYFETFRRDLEIPKTFHDYNQVSSFFTRSRNPASPTQFGSTVAVGNVAVSPSEFMSRLFAEGGNLLDVNGRIQIDTPEALLALQNYQETYACADRTVYDFWKNVLEGFAEGSAATTIVFINYASHILNSKMSSIAGKLGFAPVPGGKPLLGGGVVGITRECAHPETACAFLSWLYSDLVAPVFTMLGGLSPCRSAYGNRDINEKYPWLSTARRSFPMAQRRGNSTLYQNFSELQLESILASNIPKAVLGVMTAKEALEQAQKDCEQYFIKNG